jgi:hypothetical protein
VSGKVSALLDEGYITAAGGRLHLSAAMTEDDIDEFVPAMERIIVKRITGAGGT